MATAAARNAFWDGRGFAAAVAMAAARGRVSMICDITMAYHCGTGVYVNTDNVGVLYAPSCAFSFLPRAYEYLPSPRVPPQLVPTSTSCAPLAYRLSRTRYTILLGVQVINYFLN